MWSQLLPNVLYQWTLIDWYIALNVVSMKLHDISPKIIRVEYLIRFFWRTESQIKNLRFFCIARVMENCIFIHSRAITWELFYIGFSNFDILQLQVTKLKFSNIINLLAPIDIKMRLKHTIQRSFAVNLTNCC